jgi:hypothetical protein
MAATGEGGVTVGGHQPSAAVCTEPEYLRRRAPARVEITDAAGRPLRMTRRFVHVRAGQELKVQVVPQTPPPGGPKPVTKVRPSRALYPVVDEHPVACGEVEAINARYQARQRGNVPIPKRAALHISLTEPGQEAFTLVIPIVVWPSWWFLLGVGFLAVACPIIGSRFLELTRRLEPSEAINEMITNTSFLSWSAAFAVLAAGAMKVFGWAAVWAGWIAGDSE